MQDDPNFDLYGDDDGMEEGTAATSKGTEGRAKSAGGEEMVEDLIAGTSVSPSQPRSLPAKPEGDAAKIASFVTNGRRGAGNMRGIGAMENDFSSGGANADDYQPTKIGNSPVLGSSASASTPKGLNISEVHWWTTDHDIQSLCSDIGAPVELKQIFFAEHKVNGKSKGVVFIDFSTSEHALLAKQWFDANLFQNKKLTALISSTNTAVYKTVTKDSYQNNGMNMNNNRLIRQQPMGSIGNNSMGNNNNNNNNNGRPIIGFRTPMSQNNPAAMTYRPNTAFQPPPPFLTHQQQQHNFAPQLFNPAGGPANPMMMNMNMMYGGAGAMGAGGGGGFNPMMPMIPGMMPGMMPMSMPNMMGGGMGGMAGMGGMQQQGAANRPNPALNPLFFAGGGGGAAGLLPGGGGAGANGVDDGSRKRTRNE